MMMYIQNQVESAHLLTPVEEQDHLKICKSQLVPRLQNFLEEFFFSLSIRKKKKKGGGSCAQIEIE